jgi:hypothetical protein
MFRATAEHVVARRDGGRLGNNIKLACVRCNTLRHARKRVRSHEAYKAMVARRINAGRWFPDAKLLALVPLRIGRRE